jgi:hypothetical protein
MVGCGDPADRVLNDQLTPTTTHDSRSAVQ